MTRVLSRAARLPAAVLALCLGLLLAVSGCSTADERPSIVVTTNILGDVVKNMVGDGVDVHVLMKPNADPHSFGVSAKEAGHTEQADLIVANGLGLEEGLESNLASAREQGVPVLEVGDHVDPMTYVSGATSGAPDPHFWTDPARMIKAVDAIEKRLGDVLDGKSLGTMKTSTSSYRDRLKDLDAEISDKVSAIPEDQRKLITNHHVFGYMAQRFNFEVLGAVVPSGTTLAAPSASDLNDLSVMIREHHVPAIFVDSSHPQKLAQVLADQANVDVKVVSLYSESLTEPDQEAGNFIDMQKINIDRIASGLAGKQA